MANAGRKKSVDLSAMAVLALLVMRKRGVTRKRGPGGETRDAAVRAAIRAWFTWTDEAPSTHQVDAHVSRVLKELQRLERLTEKARSADIAAYIHPYVIQAAMATQSGTNEPIAETLAEIAENVAAFLPTSKPPRVATR